MIERRDRGDLICGIGIAAIGIYALWTGLSLDLGSARRIGPGVFPALAGLMLVVLGGLIALRSGRTAPGDEVPAPPQPRAMILILGGLGAFAALIGTAGMVPAIFASIVISSCADRSSSLRQALVLATVLSVFAVVVFIHGLGFQARAFGAY